MMLSGPKTNESHAELFPASQPIEHAVSSLYVLSKALFLQVSVNSGILSVFLAVMFCSHRNVECIRMEWENL